MDEAYHAQARAESYRFRLIIEPAAISEPYFRLLPGWGAQMRGEHETFLVRRWVRASSVTFFEMNARFHEGLAKASGNRFFFDAVSRMTRLRRLSNYDWNHGRDRVAVSCKEHLQILDSLEREDVQSAALFMRRHIEAARSISS